MPDASPPEAFSYRRILAHIPFGPQDARVIRQAVVLAKAHGAELRLLHIVDVDTALDGGACLTPGQAGRGYAAVALPRLQAMARSIKGIPVECHVGVGSGAPALDAFSRDWMPDLVVTPRPALAVSQGPWDVLILNAPTTSWLGRLLGRDKSRPAPASLAAAMA